MLKNKRIRRLALIISLIMLFTSTINTTFGFIVTKTDSLINTFVPFESIISKLLISKSIDHPFGEDYAIPDNIAFDFMVDFGALYAGTTIQTSAGDIVADENGSIRISVKPGKAFSVDNIDVGTKVTVTEIQNDGNGFTVKDNAATMEGVVSEDGSLKFRYVNIYAPASVTPTNVFVTGNKILEGREWQSGDSFSFVLEQKNDENWTKLGEQTVTYNAENADFNKFDFSNVFQTLTFDKVGIYTFRMSEIKGTLEDVNYDKTVNHFTVKVTDVDMDGVLEINNIAGSEHAEVTKENDGYIVCVTFNNTFVAPVVPDPEPITVQIGIDKIINNIGEATHGKDGFQFLLENVTTSEKLSATSDDNGKASFLLTFTETDIEQSYVYKLSEINQDFAGMTYDADVHEITITVSLNENNELVAVCTMDGERVNALSAVFENTYDAAAPSAPTGDTANTTLWFILMIASGVICIFLIIADKKYRDKEKQ